MNFLSNEAAGKCASTIRIEAVHGALEGPFSCLSAIAWHLSFPQARPSHREWQMEAKGRNGHWFGTATPYSLQPCRCSFSNASKRTLSGRGSFSNLCRDPQWVSYWVIGGQACLPAHRGWSLAVSMKKEAQTERWFYNDFTTQILISLAQIYWNYLKYIPFWLETLDQRSQK